VVWAFKEEGSAVGDFVAAGARRGRELSRRKYKRGLAWGEKLATSNSGNDLRENQPKKAEQVEINRITRRKKKEGWSRL